MTLPDRHDGQRFRVSRRRPVRRSGSRRSGARRGSARSVTRDVPVANIEFGRAHNRVHIPGPCSTSRCRKRTPTPWRLCIAQCDVLMQRNEQRRGITAVVLSKLFASPGGFPRCPRSPSNSTFIRAPCGVDSPRRGHRFARCSTKRAPRWRSTCFATSASRWTRCRSGWGIPTPRRSVTHSNAGTVCRPAGIRTRTR